MSSCETMPVQSCKLPRPPERLPDRCRALPRELPRAATCALFGRYVEPRTGTHGVYDGGLWGWRRATYRLPGCP